MLLARRRQGFASFVLTAATSSWHDLLMHLDPLLPRQVL